MRLAALQLDCVWHDRKANYAKARALAREAVDRGADLVALPEMFATGFSMDTAVTAEPLDGPTPDFLRALARDLHVLVSGGFALKRPEDQRPQNVALSVGPDGRDLALYPKIHQIALLHEDNHYAPGDLPRPFPYKGTEIACFVCFDLRFPELFRTVVDTCGLILVIASWPAPRQTHWDILLQARAVECQCVLLGVNRVGQGGGHRFTGGSAIYDPLGNALAKGGHEEACVVAEADLGQVRKVREAMPFLASRKAHLFEGLAAGLR